MIVENSIPNMVNNFFLLIIFNFLVPFNLGKMYNKSNIDSGDNIYKREIRNTVMYI